MNLGNVDCELCGGGTFVCWEEVVLTGMSLCVPCNNKVWPGSNRCWEEALPGTKCNNNGSSDP
jgi:hypothetical protein